MKPFFKTDEHFENPFFIGTVVDNKDPTNNYRVKVRINHLHDTIDKDENLPWAAKVDSSFMGMDSSSISHSVPEVDSKVLVLAVGDNINSLVYLGCLYKKTDSTPTNDDYLNCYGIYDKNGNYIKLDKIKKLLELIWEGTINIDKVKEMTITVNGNVNLTANSTNITAPTNNIKGNVNIDGTLDVTGATTMKSTLDVTGLVTGQADVKAGGGSVGMLTHTHPGVFPGPSSTGTGQG
ncbi:MAG: hypothetical protein J5691_01535 [Bacilli bacterium]|nr:hypothetical protein [Bacilli bacterium]